MAQPAQPPAHFQDRQLAFHIGMGVGVGVDQGIAHPGLGGQMDNAGNARMGGAHSG